MKALQTSKDLRIRVRGCLQNNYFSFKDHRLCVRSLQRKKKKERKKETKFEVTVVEQEEARKETEWESSMWGRREVFLSIGQISLSSVSTEGRVAQKLPQ